MFSDWALANLSTIHDEPLFHKKMEISGAFFQHIMLRWRDIEKKKFAQKTPMIKALTRNLHYVFKSLAFIKQQGQRFFEVAFFCLQTSNLFIFWQFYAWGYSIGKDSSADLGVNSKIVQIRPTVYLGCQHQNFKKIFCIYVNILIFLRENNEASFFLFWIFKLKQP